MNTKQMVGIGLVFALVAFIIGGMAVGVPIYNVWKAEKHGEASLAEAREDRLIEIEEARAELESAKLRAQAEVERAKGMAEAMEIEGGVLTEQYIHYLWVRQNDFDNATTIYVPTESNLPIMEAGRTPNVE